jgi:hypothetical protein
VKDFGYDIHAFGAEEATEWLADTAARVSDMRGVEKPIDDTLNQEYEQKFREWQGWLVDTGALRESLTDDHALGALREAHLDEVDFGSQIAYARFHSRALLDVTPTLQTDVSEAVADYYAGDDDGLDALRTPRRP